MPMRWTGFCSMHNSGCFVGRHATVGIVLFGAALDRHDRHFCGASPLSASCRCPNDERLAVCPLIVIVISSTLYE